MRIQYEVLAFNFFFFFFSSRRRHTRFDCDWSSDVCSSDLGRVPAERQRITFVVRADSMRPVDAGGAPTENVVSGVIKGLEYAGSVMLMVLDLGSDQELKVEQHESLSLGREIGRAHV